MVAIEEISDTPQGKEEEQQQPLSASEERRLDSEAIEDAAKKMTRVSARMHLEALAKKLRKESDALARMDQIKKKQEDQSSSATPARASEESKEADSAVPLTAVPPTRKTTPMPLPSSSAKFTPIDKFAFDEGGYNGAFVTLYIDLPGVGSIPRDQITCQFTKDSFDLIVQDLDKKSYRLYKTQLEKDIETNKSKIVIKAQKILVKLAKKKGEYGGYDHWSKLTDPKKDSKSSSKPADPQGSIMEMMKNMYDDGDDNMKKMIGETMMKQKRGELGGSDPMGGMPGMDDMGGGDF